MQDFTENDKKKNPTKYRNKWNTSAQIDTS